MKRQFLAGFGVLALMVSSASSVFAGTISLTNSTPGTFDASSDTRSVTVTGLEAGFGSGIITDVNISINFAKADGEAFAPPYPTGTPFYNEIHFSLSGPTLGPVELIAAGSFNTGSSGTQFDGTIVFDDAAAQVVNFNLNQPSAGTFRPTGPGALSLFDGSSALGTWTLFIQDTVGADALRFRNFTLDIQTDAAAVPEPASMLLMGSGLAALAARRRRKLSE